jgi:hypothetical protein
MIFHHLRDSAEPAPGLLPSLFRRQPGSNSIPLDQFQVRLDFAFQLLIELPFPKQGRQTSDGQPELHDFTSKNRATKAVALSQFATSTLSCFDPAFVSE